LSRRLLILVEGQTEERFVKDVLASHLFPAEIYPASTILTTKRVKDGPDFKGGVTTFAKFDHDVQRLLRGAGEALVTTMLDYYGLPEDFPGMSSRPVGASPRARVEHVEASIHDHYGAPKNFAPFLAMHEFEGLLFSDDETLSSVMIQPDKAKEVAAIRAGVATPEEINDRPEFAPSKRIKALFPAYRKTLHGPTAASRLGMDTIRGNCPHFDAWISKIENYWPR
jgi:hypothetical protein